MLAEIFVVRLETLRRVATSSQATTASNPCFVPVKLPREDKPEAPSNERTI
jgi:hypothetical protein